MWYVLRVVFAVNLLLLLASVPAQAQLATAELNGRVTDSSGAVLPGVTFSPDSALSGGVS